MRARTYIFSCLSLFKRVSGERETSGEGRQVGDERGMSVRHSVLHDTYFYARSFAPAYGRARATRIDEAPLPLCNAPQVIKIKLDARRLLFRSPLIARISPFLWRFLIFQFEDFARAILFESNFDRPLFSFIRNRIRSTEEESRLQGSLWDRPLGPLSLRTYADHKRGSAGGNRV